MKKIHIIIGMLLLTTAATAQMKINDPLITGTTLSPDPSAILELASNNKGLLMPRVLLSATNVWGLAGTTAVSGMTVYNTNTTTGTYAVTPGIYYYNTVLSLWVPVSGTVASNAWSLTGNAGTMPGTNFMGTTDNEDVLFERNNIQAGLLQQGGSGPGNTTWGVGALLNVATGGSLNVAIGYQTLYSNTGSANTGIGYQALYSNTSGGVNTAIGQLALYTNGIASGNVAIGNYALQYNLSGNDNTAAGVSALQYNLGQQNTATGWGALGDNTGGSYNTAVGNGALSVNTTGTENVAIGEDANVGYNNLIYATAIGASSIVSTNYTIQLGSTYVTSILAPNGTSIYSDGRYKKNITQNVPGLDFIKQLTPVTYNYDIHGLNSHMQPNAKEDSGELKIIKEAAINAKEKIVYSGFVAQDVEKAANKIGYDFSGLHKPQNDRDVYALSYSDFVPPIVKAIQELSTQNDSLSAQNDSLQSAITQQQQVNNNLQQQLNDLKSTISQMQFAMSQCCNNFASSMLSQSATLGKPAVGNLDQPILNQNAPNPYNSSTVIGYYLSASTNSAQLLVTDINGQELKTITLTGTGNGQITINAGTLTSGNYFYTLIVDGQKIATKQMVLTK